VAHVVKMDVDIAPMDLRNNKELPTALFCWSGGKDSAYCLHKVITENLFDVKYLLTTINDSVQRISMHGVREELLDKQIGAIGIPALKVRIKEGTHGEYETLMETALLQAKSEGVKYVIFGDIFLKDLRAYREQNLAKVDMVGVFPLWEMNTSELIWKFIDEGFKTVTCCINDGYFDESWVGKEIDSDFMNDLPDNVDPCGENGEYHTFCYQGPLFNKPITFALGEKLYKPLEYALDDVCQSPVQTKGFWYCDLIPN